MMTPKEMSAAIRAKKKTKVEPEVENEPLPLGVNLDTATNLETNEAMTSDNMEPSETEKKRMEKLRKKLAEMKMHDGKEA